MANAFDVKIDRSHTGSLKWEKYRDTDILPMWVADMDFAVADEIQNALQKRVSHPVYGYTIATSNTANIVCEMLKKEFNWGIDQSWIVWLPGVVSGLWAACAAFGGQGDEVIFNTPIYHHFFSVPGQAGKTAVKVALRQQSCGRWTYDFDALQAAVTDKTSLMLLCSPHNPTGTLFTKEETREMVDFCSRNNLTIVSDEIHCGLVLSEKKKHIPTVIASPNSVDSMVTLMSPSKTFNLAGLNCSFAIISNEKLRNQFVNTCQDALPMVPGLAYTALEAAYSKSEIWHRQLLKTLRSNHDYLVREISTIKGLKMTPMEATYLAWINTDELAIENASAFFEQHGVGLSPGAGFGSRNYVRLNFACPFPMLKEAVDRMRKAAESLSKSG